MGVRRVIGMSGEVRALDLFAGTGWGVACQRIGVREGGVEIMPEAIASREAAGMHTPYFDVWEGLLGDDPVRFWHALQIASPPCQSFSVAGKGAGRAALDDVLRAIDNRAYEKPERLRALGADTDDRTALVLTPLAHVYRDRPLYVAWEQVPPVLPVWQAAASVLERWGYSTWTGIMRAEQYGVPQTRRRAVLIARADGIDATPPAPTHSRYYEREPYRLDAGVSPWVSMAEALGWNDVAGVRVATGQNSRIGGGETRRYSRDVALPAPTITGQARSWTLRSNYGTGGDASKRGERRADQPAPTITSKADRNKWDGSRGMTAEEAATLQSYPQGFPFAGAKVKQFLQIGNAVPPLMAEAIVAELLAPAALRAEVVRDMAA